MANTIHPISREYTRLRQLNKDIKSTKSRLTTAIMKKVRPLMWESGYCGPGYTQENKRMLKIYVFPRCLKKNVYYKLPKSDIEFCGFTEENAIITDAIGGGMACTVLSEMPVTELMKLYTFVMTTRSKLFMVP